MTNRYIHILLPLSLIAISSTVSTLFADPINAPKLFISIIAALLMAVGIYSNQKLILDARFRNVVWIISLFGLSFCISGILTNTPIYRILIGTGNRNNGLASYLSLGIFFLGSYIYGSKFKSSSIVKVLAIFGGVQGLYGLIQSWNLDFFNYKYAGNPVVLTFGNENFSSTFLVLSALASLYMLFNEKSNIIKFAFFIIWVVQSYLVIFISNAQTLISLTASTILFISILKLNLTNKRHLLSFSAIAFFFSMIAILGLLGRGPFKFISDNLESLQSRYMHWISGWRMFTNSPYFGVGIDSYGDFQRLYLSKQPDGSIETYSNNAHNVFIQFMATGGILLWLGFSIFLSYSIAKLILGIRKNSISKKEYAFYISFLSIYFVHLIVNIDNIGTGIWFWSILGLMVGNIDRDLDDRKSSERRVSAKSAKFVLIFFLTFSTLIQSLSLFYSISDLKSQFVLMKLYKNPQKLTANKLALEIYNESRNLRDSTTQMNSVIVLYNMGQIDLGYKLANNIHRQSSRNVPSLLAIAAYQEHKRHFDSAFRTRTKIRKLDPFNIENNSALNQLKDM